MASPGAIEPSTTPSKSPYQLNSAQVLRATTTLIAHMQADALSSASKTTNLLASDEPPSEIIWLVLSTKKHISDHSRLKPGKISLPNPLPPPATGPLTICLIVPDPPGPFTAALTHPAFPTSLAKRITRTLSIKHLKAATKSFEERRALLAAHDVFLADDRVITLLPRLLGKTFYATAAKRPLPVNLAAPTPSRTSAKSASTAISTPSSNADGTKMHSVATPTQVARELEHALAAVPVYLASSTSTSVRAGTTAQTGAEVAANVEAVVTALVARFVPRGWRNVRAFHIKGPRTPALPIWLADTLWVDEADVHEEMVDMGGKSRKKGGEDGREKQQQKEPKTKKTLQESTQKKISGKRKADGGNDVDNEGFSTDMAERRKKLREARQATLKELEAEQQQPAELSDGGVAL